MPEGLAPSAVAERIVQAIVAGEPVVAPDAFS
jgi:hypothetical protein